eukprot:TRINITY_DN57188_c0_g1_i1.p1 TRINITY_DN57188_c0_g1~~TRINITY_DN57188_c0_g1_i1.p1  ORF type:complete len:852 (-),score=222.54 TRINITY_DN57188_c0_g1_i1:117-2672(-)
MCALLARQVPRSALEAPGESATSVLVRRLRASAGSARLCQRWRPVGQSVVLGPAAAEHPAASSASVARRASSSSSAPRGGSLDMSVEDMLWSLRSGGDSAKAVLAKFLPVIFESGQLQQTETYAAVMRTIARQALWEESLTLLANMRKDGVQASMEVCSAAMMACERAQQWERSLQLLHGLRGFSLAPDVACFRTVVSACESERQWTVALSLLEEMQDRKFAADRLTYNVVIRMCEDRGNVELAKELSELCRRSMASAAKTKKALKGQTPHSVFKMPFFRGGQFYAKQELLRKLLNEDTPALEVLQAISALRSQNLLETSKECTIVLNALQRRGLWRSAILFFEELEEKDIRDFRADVVTVTSVIGACEKGRQWQHAVHLLFEMPVRLMRPDVIAFNAALSACEKAGAWQAALAVTAAMEFHAVIPDAMTFNTAMSACRSGGHWEMTLHLASLMEESLIRRDAFAYNVLVRTCSQGGLWQEALQLIGEMQESHYTPDAYTYDSGIRACGSVGQWYMASLMFAKMKAVGLAPDTLTYNAVAGACLNGGYEAGAHEAFQEMSSVEIDPDWNTYRLMIELCALRQEWQAAVKLLDAMWETGRTPSEEVYLKVMEVCGCQGKWSQVLQIQDTLESRQIEVDQRALEMCSRACRQAALHESGSRISPLAAASPAVQTDKERALAGRRDRRSDDAEYLKTLKKAELQALLKEKKLAVSGRKDVMVQRLVDAGRSKQRELEAEAPSVEKRDLRGRFSDELRVSLKSEKVNKKLKVSTTRAELVQNLLQASHGATKKALADASDADWSSVQTLTTAQRAKLRRLLETRRLQGSSEKTELINEFLQRHNPWSKPTGDPAA